MLSFQDEHDNLFEKLLLQPCLSELKISAGATEHISRYIPQHFTKRSSERYALNGTN
jgi:hypothetical protein